MILYKYVDFDTACLIMENSTLKFSKSSSFNDPFELTSLFYDKEGPLNQHLLKHIAASESYGILSLTRTPLNPLMWAHYARGDKVLVSHAIELDHNNRSHAGVVFGIDVDMAGFNNDGQNVIPAKYGSVIYTSTRPRHPFENSENHGVYEGLLYNFQPELLEALQRVFLYKSFHWSYEEEVRVVRNTCGQPFKEIQCLTRDCFKEVYLGIRNSFNNDYLLNVRAKILKSFPDCNIYVCRYDESEWLFKRVLLEDVIK